MFCLYLDFIWLTITVFFIRFIYKSELFLLMYKGDYLKVIYLTFYSNIKKKKLKSNSVYKKVEINISVLC